MKLSVVIPAYNEEAIVRDTIRTLSDALCAMCRSAVIDDYELIFVSDGSADCTPQYLQEASDTDAHLRACIYTPNRGKGCAVRTGVLASTGDIVLYTDCDLAYGTDVIASAVRQLTNTGADILIGSRAIHPEGYAGYTPLRKLASVLYLRILSVAAGFRHSDSQAGFKAMRGDVGREIFAQCIIDRFAFDLEMLMRAQKAGCTITELPVKIVNHRESSIHLIRDSIRMLRDIVRIKKNLK
ncbi:MAG: glycosyltransferase family 2 protein [Clostridia bacterium]|nr:glycosyltransferase family 2 protein [Clostridia bacterium]